MLTVIHGSDTAASRKYFFDEKQRFPDALLLDADKVNLTDLAQIFEGGGLFGESKFIFIEQYITKKKKNADYKDIIAYLEKNADEHTIYLWEGKELEPSTQKTFKKALVRPFKLPQTLFAFLDAIKPGNGKALISLFHQTIENTETEMVFFMLVRHFRFLLVLQDRSHPVDIEIDELRRMAPWQKTKLEKQAALFTEEHLKTLYLNLYSIEKGQKTGGLTSSLPSTIDFFLLSV